MLPVGFENQIILDGRPESIFDKDLFIHTLKKPLEDLSFSSFDCIEGGERARLNGTIMFTLLGYKFGASKNLLISNKYEISYLSIVYLRMCLTTNYMAEEIVTSLHLIVACLDKIGLIGNFNILFFLLNVFKLSKKQKSISSFYMLACLEILRRITWLTIKKTNFEAKRNGYMSNSFLKKQPKKSESAAKKNRKEQKVAICNYIKNKTRRSRMNIIAIEEIISNINNGLV